MKIDTDRLTPLFDQYSNQENRLTHSLMHTLAGSDKILKSFFGQILGIRQRSIGKEVEITTQKRPFSQEDMDLDRVDSVPDGWIIDKQGGIGILIEVKDIKNSVRLGQLRSHLKRLDNFESSILLVITPDLNLPQKIDSLNAENKYTSKIIWQSWNNIYVFFNKCREDQFYQMPKERYILDAMLEYLEQRREVLGFQGIKFRRGFDIEEAKKILVAEMDALKNTVNTFFPALTSRRGAITTAFSKSAVWDCFGVAEGFTSDIHITVSIHEAYQDISLTIPHRARQRWKRLKSIFSNDDNERALFNILKKLRMTAPDLFLEFHQRHFLYQRKGVRDAFLEFHIDTFGAPFLDDKSKVKAFPIWFQALKEAILNKRKVNAQTMFKVRFYLDDTPNLDNEKFLDTARKTLESLKPLYSFLSQTNGA